MADETVGKGDGSVPGSDAGAGAPAGSGGDSGATEQGNGSGAAGETFDRSKLTPVLRNMSPDQISELFETMATGLRAAGGGGGNREEAPKPPVREPVKKPTRDELKEMLDPSSDNFNPEAAFGRIVEANYGPLIGGINKRAINGMFGTFRAELPDFKDYEQEIQQALSTRDASTISEQDVLASYFTAKGMRRTLKEKNDSKKKALTTTAPSARENKEKVEDLSEVEKDVARKMFRHHEDPEKEYRRFLNSDQMSVKVPVGGGKKV